MFVSYLIQQLLQLYLSLLCCWCCCCCSWCTLVIRLLTQGPRRCHCGGGCCGGSVSTGCAYQCVELAQRYFHEKFGTPKIWDNIAYAKQMCSNRPPGVKKTSNPQPGDLWVRSSGTYGHVAVITAVHSSKVDVIEQNSSPSGKNTYAKSDAACFLTHLMGIH